MTAAAPDLTTNDRSVRDEVVHEAATMVLYVSIVEIAELAAIPESHFATGSVTGPVGAELIALLWGTAMGLALAHWFAFGFAARGFRGERHTRLDTYVGLAQVGAAAFVAAISSLPALFLSDENAQVLTGYIPAVLVGVVSYLIARSGGRSRTASVVYGITALVLGFVVAFAKSRLAAH